MGTRQGQARAEPFTPGEGQGRGEDAGPAAPKNAPGSGARQAETGTGGTREVAGRQGPTAPATRGIRPCRCPRGDGRSRRRRCQDGGAPGQQPSGGGTERDGHQAQRGGQGRGRRARATHRRGPPHAPASARSARRPRGAGRADARRAPTASSGLLGWGGPGGKSERLGAGPAATGAGAKTSSRRAVPPVSRGSRPPDGLGAPGRRRGGGARVPHRTDGQHRAGVRPSGRGGSTRRGRACSSRAWKPTSPTPRPACAQGVGHPTRCRSSPPNSARRGTCAPSLAPAAVPPGTMSCCGGSSPGGAATAGAGRGSVSGGQPGWGQKARGARPRLGHPQGASGARCWPPSTDLGGRCPGPSRIARGGTSRGMRPTWGVAAAREARPSPPGRRSRRACRHST